MVKREFCTQNACADRSPLVSTPANSNEKKPASGGFQKKDWPRERGQYVPSVITSNGGWESTCS
jgi:hypothetical protein